VSRTSKDAESGGGVVPLARESRGAPGTSTQGSLRRAFGVVGVLRRHGLLKPGTRPEPVQVREALEELGPVFQKFGQVLALRRDLLPDAFVRELEALHDRVPPLPFDAIRAVVERELDGPIGDLFAEFDPEPMAAATIAQVHAARLSDGRHVVVKVRRPDLRAVIDRDTAVLGHVARLLDRAVPPLRMLDLPVMAVELRESLRREADFRLEVTSIRRFRDKLSDFPRVWVPDAVEALSTEAVLTMEHSPGERIDAYVRDHPDEAPELASAVAALVLRQIFEDGLFHADPHPGNLFVLPDGRLCLHDFGMIGELSEPVRHALGDLLAAEVRGDAAAAVDAYLRLGLPGADLDRGALEDEFERLLAQMHSRPLAEISLADELQELLRVGGRSRIRNPREMLLLTRAFVIAEALLRRLDPDINVIDVFRGQLGRIEAARFGPENLRDDGADMLRAMEHVTRDLPRNVEKILRRLGQGNLGRVRDENLAREVKRLGQAVATATTALIGGGAIIAAAVLIAGGSGGVLWLGVGTGVVGALALIRTYFRARRGP
jgi:ubiquinone biosynthesis protein